MRLTVAAAAVAIIGLLLLQAGSAATFAVSGEAESGTFSGNAAPVTVAGASGQAVRFGTAASVAIEAPYLAHAWVGGDSIAVVWSKPFGAVRNYEVYRNDTKIATVTSGSGTLPQDTNGRTYIDKNVTKGSSYTYKIRAIGTNGSTSAFKSTATVTHPSSSAPIPNVTINTSKGGSDLSAYLQNDIKPHLQTWYPKIAHALAYPDYTPLSNIELYMDPAYDGVAYVGGGAPAGRITVGSAWLSENKEDGQGMFLHEATHIVQSYPGSPDTPGFMVEGIADWIRDRMTLERWQIPGPNATLSMGYSEGGGMLQWAQQKYDAGLIRKVNLKMHSATYNESYFKSLTGGRTPGQIYDDYKAQYYGTVGNLVGPAGKCAIIASESTANGALIQLNTCNSTLKGQPWSIVFQDAGLYGTAKTRGSLANGLLGSMRCFHTQSNATANGTTVYAWPCIWGHAAQTWVFNSNGTIVNPNSGRCLSTTDDSSNDGNQLIIRDCALSPGQVWTWPK